MAGVSIPTARVREMRPWVCRLVRVGYAAKAVIYVLIGVLALRLALGEGGRLTDSSGALQTLVSQPFGIVLMALIGIGILAYSGWEITQAVIDSKGKGSGPAGWASRALSMVKGAVYGLVGVQALRLVLGSRQSSDGADDYAQTAMEFPLGDVLLMLVGVGIAAYGIKQLWMAWRSDFDDDLDQQQLRREGTAWVLHLGRVGIGARGIIMLFVGWALLQAGIAESPSKAGGMSEALSTVLSLPYGRWLLASVAAGLICFGVFQALHSRYARL